MDKIESKLIKAASELLECVQNPDLTREELCRILSLQTFRDLGSESAFIGEITQKGTLAVTHAFGIQAREIESWKEIPLTSETPISVSISENKPVWLDLAQDKYELFPAMKKFRGHGINATLILIPVRKFGIPLGAIGLFSRYEVEETFFLDIFFELVAGIISSSLNASSSFVTSLPTLKPRTSIHEILSTREENILEMLGRSKTNAQIANDLGLDDSVVRQDTIHIYRKLGINSRSEAKAFYKKNLAKQKELKT